MDNSIPFGLGIIAGVSSLYLIIQLWPVVMIGGAAVLITKGLESTIPNKEK